MEPDPKERAKEPGEVLAAAGKTTRRKKILKNSNLDKGWASEGKMEAVKEKVKDSEHMKIWVNMFFYQVLVLTGAWYFSENEKANCLS